jgi:hypothetical protein
MSRRFRAGRCGSQAVRRHLVEDQAIRHGQSGGAAAHLGYVKMLTTPTIRGDAWS